MAPAVVDATNFVRANLQMILENGGAWRVNVNGTKLGATKTCAWTNNTSNDTIDAALSRGNSGQILIGTGAAGSFAGSLKATNAELVGTLSVTGASTFGGLIEQRNGTAAQESRIYGTYSGAGADYRRLALKMSTAGVAQIVAEGAGTGAVGNVLQLPSNTTFADAPATRTALGLGTGDSPTFAGLNAVGNGVTTTTLGADGRQSWFFNNSGVAAGQISYSTPNAEPGILIIKGTGRSDIRAVSGMGIAIASYSSGSGAPAEQFRFSLAGNMLVGTTSETGLTSGGLRTSGNAIIGGTLSVTGASTFGGLIEQRNGTAAQESRIYGTYTDGSNYRRLALKMSSAGVAQIVAEGAGSGAVGNRIEIDGLRIGKGGGDVASNTALGASALNANTSGSSNSAAGVSALRFNTTGQSNSAVGLSALRNNTTGSNNSAVGVNSLFSNTSGGSNSAVGISAGRYIADGTTANEITNNSVYLGNDTKALANNQTNQIVIGHNATGLGSNTAVLGNDSIVTTALKGNVGIGTTSPASKLTVTGGDIEVTDSASGIILKSPDGTRYRVTVSDLGILSTASLP
jgi:hypothetical protein